MNRFEKAESLFLANNNCAQSVLAAFGDDTGLDDRTALLVASSFGGGMGGMGGPCGAFTGALMVLGLLHGYTDPANKQSHHRRVKEFAAKFTEKCGSTNCRELLGLLAGKVDKAAKKPCLGYVLAAVELLEEYV